MKKLQELEFIDIKAGKSGPMGNAIIWNPHWIIRHHHHIRTPGLTEASFAALMETAFEIGATDMTLPWQPFSPLTQPAPAFEPVATAPSPEPSIANAAKALP